MKKKYLLASSPILIGVICMISYFMIGSEVNPDGILIEPFFLIPLRYLFVTGGIVALLFVAISSVFQRKANLIK
ncbi:DUF3955 domain-containing protein [Paenibacillus sp. HWE-109]|uniref:DUF3955 domain-containing protein n=1 Tax=Paenibacillus sp. HWE-109 TaxID=1306526 RepID=UPI001EDD7405|nr:DUF3955 domain-containing protein [Paenibacillus sp. HWE-109]UKS24118.1 DUF3955 domain-containing protein [Paenibacillus sp. HWE-109]